MATQVTVQLNIMYIIYLYNDIIQRSDEYRSKILRCYNFSYRSLHINMFITRGYYISRLFSLNYLLMQSFSNIINNTVWFSVIYTL